MNSATARKAMHEADRLIAADPNVVLFVSPLLRAREVKMAATLRQIGWKVVLVYLQTTPFTPKDYFDIAIRAHSEREAHAFAKALRPRVCHAFSGAVDGLLVELCRDKPGPLIIDLNDVFCPSLFNYCTERFEPTRECLAKADAFCARDLQARAAERLDGFKLPEATLLFPEYTWSDAPAASLPTPADTAVHVVSVGTFCLEARGEYDSCYLKLAELLASQRIHLHIYPHWFYRKDAGSVFNWDIANDFVDFFRLQQQTEYLHIHESVAFDVLGRELQDYDFGIVSGGCAEFGQRLALLKPEYMATCYSGRISDYLDARLPVLINPEVRFNYRLLAHYRVGVDLHGVLEPGFRERLLAVKHDAARRRAVADAANRLSLARHGARLAGFYESVAGAPSRIRLPRSLSRAQKLPLIGSRLRYMQRRVEDLQETADRLHRDLGRFHRQNARDRRRIERLRLENAQDQSRIGHLALESAEGRRGIDRLTLENAQHQSRIDRLTLDNAEGQSRIASLQLENVELHRKTRIDGLSVDALVGLLNWPEAVVDYERNNGFKTLLHQMQLFTAGNTPLDGVSSAWDLLSEKNFDQLLRHGYADFKRTVATNYFTFLVQDGDPQIAALEAALGAATSARLKEAADWLPDDPGLDLPRQATYRYFLLLLWTYVRARDQHAYLDRLDEPADGNPIVVEYEGQRISQDLLNSVLEYYSIGEAVDFSGCRRVLEIGGGYGRDAFVIRRLNAGIQYTLVDIPPAIYIAQRYLSSIFPDQKIFEIQDFTDFAEVRESIETSSLVFMLPHQLRLLPDRWFDLILNISSFGEMHPDVIAAYFDEIDRLARGVFYMKQWKVSKNPFDRVDVLKDDYPVKADWVRLFERDVPVQSGFFEAAYRIGDRR